MRLVSPQIIKVTGVKPLLVLPVVSFRYLLEVAQYKLLCGDFSESCSLLLLVPILRTMLPLRCAPHH